MQALENRIEEVQVYLKNQLSQGEQQVLSQGLKFAPLHKLNTFETFIDVHKCVHKINIKRHFIMNPIENRSPVTSTSLPQVNLGGDTRTRHTKFSNASWFNPPGFVAPSVQVFKDMVLKDLEALKFLKLGAVCEFQQDLKQICV